MYLLYCDETNLVPAAGDFLIYGGVTIPADNAHAFSIAIDQLRAEAGVDREFSLKFNPGPDHLTHRQFIDLKQRIFELCVDHYLKLLCYVVLHDIATTPDVARRNGINKVALNYDLILGTENACGIVLIDRFTDEGNRINHHLNRKFSVGIEFPNNVQRRLGNILGFHYSAIGQSHFPSVIDILLGSLRFAINRHTRNQENHAATARTLLGNLNPIFWRGENDTAIPEWGFSYSPSGLIQHTGYRQQYINLKSFLAENGLPTQQRIVSPEDQMFG